MLDAVALAKALATVPLVSLGGPWHRAIDQEYLTSYSAKNEGAGTILAVLTDHLPKFPPSFVEMIDSSGKLAQRLP